MSHARRVLTNLGRNRRLRVGALLLALLVVTALFAEVVAGDAPVVAIGHSGFHVLAAVTDRAGYSALSRAQIDARHAGDATVWPLLRQGPDRRSTPLLAPSSEHPLGTDSSGYDVLAQLVYGARAALGPTALAMLLAAALGISLGGLSGFFGGFWDELLARPIEVMQAFPTVLVVALAMAVDPRRGPTTLLLALVAVRSAETARIMRVETLRATEQEYVTAARALGASPWRILRRHILPQALRSVLISAANALPGFVLLETAVSFLGIGLPSSWGTLIAGGLAPNGPHLAAIMATLALALTVVGAQLVAEAVSEALDAKIPPIGSAKVIAAERAE